MNSILPAIQPGAGLARVLFRKPQHSYLHAFYTSIVTDLIESNEYTQV